MFCPEACQRTHRHPVGPRPVKGIFLSLVILSLVLPACGNEAAEQPPYYEVVELQGTPYERGFQHGQALAGKIASFYTRFLSAGILPWFNRERDSVADILKEYQDPKYDDGQFAYLTLLESGQRLAANMPPEYVEEMQGIADGSGVDYDRILILNTFLDTLYGMRSIIMLINVLKDPALQGVTFERKVGGLWVPVGKVFPYHPSPFASIAEIPTDVRFRIRLQDSSGVDPESIRLQLNQQVFFAGDPAIELREHKIRKGVLEVILTPPEPLEAATLQSLQVQCGDLDIKDWPPPAHGNVMRDERMAFTTKGYAKAHGIRRNALHEIPNIGDVDERLQPTSLAFGVRGTATTTGETFLAHHFVGLDNNTAHKHGIVFVHHPSEGKPFVVVGMAGVIWGTSGMSGNGLAYSYNLCDTLDNPVTNEFLHHLIWAKLLSDGIPIGVLMRETLQNADNVDEAQEYIKDKPKTFGWNILLADAARNMSVVEVDANILNKLDGGFYAYHPVDPPVINAWYPGKRLSANRDKWGRAWASVGTDDIRTTMHFQANSDDFDLKWFPLNLPQQFWTTYTYRSWRTFYLLGNELEANYGTIDLEGVKRIMRVPELNDVRNSMNATILAPESLQLWAAIGTVPATDSTFELVDFGSMIGK